MKRENKYKRILYGLILSLILLGMTGCGGKENTDTEIQETQSEISELQDLYMITLNDTKEESLCLRSLETGTEVYYSYGMFTRFKNKYGDITTSLDFVPGRVVTIGKTDADGNLSEVMISDKVWEYEEVCQFSINQEKGVFTIADTKYSIRDKVLLFSNDKQISMSAISKDDVLTVIGMERKILSIRVTTGHGILSLTNTELFKDSFLQLNTDIFAWIHGDMEMELPEGTYTLKVANDGWGGTKEIEISRGKTTKIDLDTMKGEGKKKGLINFDIDVENVEVYVDYKLIDHSKAVELTYGTHILQIKAEGYDSFKKYLSVNSEEATLVIELTEESESTTESESTQKEDSKDKESESTQQEESKTTESESAQKEDSKGKELESTQKEDSTATESENIQKDSEETESGNAP